MFRRIAIVNRGEPARRLIHAAHELGQELDEPIRTIAFHTAAERRATFARDADEAVEIGGGGNPYLNLVELERALRACRADAAWVGWGFVAEDPGFAELCERLGVAFVGPPAQAMRRLGDKIAAKLIAQEAGVPVAPWSGGPVDSVADALRHATAIGFPLMIKATAGRGGRGIRMVASEADLATAFEGAREEARRSFGNPTVLIERMVIGARHVEVQVIADHHGNTWALGVRDCSIQRRHQKLIEESASPMLGSDQARELGRWAVRLVAAAGYRNAGTVEFLYEPTERTFAFLEVNPRLHVEHPVTEATTGADLVKLQLVVASGKALEGEPPSERGHAIEARLNAEDPERGFALAPGRLERLRFPSGPGIRVDTGFTEGDIFPSGYDTMIAKIVAWGSDRAEARARLRRALAETSVVVAGGATNRTFLLGILDRPEVVAGTTDTGWLDRVGASELHPERGGNVALLAVAIEAHDAEETVERERFYAAARHGRPTASDEMERTNDLRHRGLGYRMSVARVGPERYRVRVDGEVLDVDVERLGPFDRRLGVLGETHRVILAASPPDQLVEVDGGAHRVTLAEGGLIRAPGPALVVAIAVAAGDEVERGDPVMVVESMKMETTITAPFAGRVREVLVAGNVQVAAGAPLVRLEAPSAGRTAEPDRPRVPFASPSSGATAEPERALADLRSLVMGYDIDAGDVRDLVDRLKGSPPGDPAQVHKELEILTVFADLAALSRDRPPVEDLPDAEDLVHSPREHFNAFLRSLDAEREGVPDPLRRSLARAVAHYGVGDLKLSPELAEACYRIFLAHRRASSQLPAVAALLDRRLHGADSLPESHRDELGQTLDRLIVATQLRHPAIGDLARRVRFACFDRPAVIAARERAHEAVRQQLDILTANPDAPDYAERIEAVVAEPHPLIRLLGERLAMGIGPHEPLLEVLTRRYYKIRELQDLNRVDVDGRQFVTATYGRREGRRVRLVTTLADASGIAEAATGIGELIGDVPKGESAVADIYVAWPDAPTDLDALSDRLATVLAAAALPTGVRRVAVSVSDPTAGVDRYFTFRRTGGGLAEESVVRGLHPMIARRLRFWRLEGFDIERMPSVEDTYLFRCSAPGGGGERLVALAEVRDLEPTRDGSGALVALPEIERILANCLESIRVSQAAAPRGRRLDANNVFLYVWPTVDVPLRDLVSVARSRLAQMTAGLGLEEAVLHFRTRNPDAGEAGEMALTFSYQPGAGATVSLSEAPDTPLATLDSYDQRKLPARRRGTVYPYELIPLIAGVAGSFTEHDLDGDGNLVPVDRPPGLNEAGIVCGLVRTPTAKYPEGICRVVLMGDPTKSLGSVAEPECRRIMAAIALAERLGVPVEWFALSSGAKISRDSGVENMEWVARALRLIVTFTQSGGEINVIVAGINVGAQPYWNAEATMLMHTRGILVMTPDSAMVLTGKHALDYSGGVSAEDNFGIGGFDRVMGPNGQAQYWAPHLAGACELLFAYYDHAYVAPGERFPRRAETSDPPDRDVRGWTLERAEGEFATVGEIFSADENSERKRPFDIRPVIRAVVDQDREPLERWAHMADAETAVVCDAHLGGQPVTVIGIESRPMPRTGPLPADGPDQWTAGTLFPLSSKKVARGINAASGNRPVVVLANLSGFDGSPESLRKWQLEYGAEIGRAVVNFDGPIVFCVISRYHGGAFVVFSAALNDNMEVIALEGSYASVIGGAPAAAVVFARDVDARTTEDPRVADIQRRLAEAGGDDHGPLLAELEGTRAAVRSEKLGEVAADFDRVHSIERARDVGSVHTIIPASDMRRYLIEAIERGMARTTTVPRGVATDAQTTGRDPST